MKSANNTIVTFSDDLKSAVLTVVYKNNGAVLESKILKCSSYYNCHKTSRFDV